MNLSVDINSPLPQYIQLSNQLANQIRSGIIQKGTRLPSVRKLSQEVGISHVTADKVFNNLKTKGLIERVQGSGSFVIFSQPFSENENLTVEFVRDKFVSLKESKNFRSLLVGLLKNTTHVCPYNFAYSILNPEIISKIIPEPMDLRLGMEQFKLPRMYGDVQGMLELRQALVDEFESDYSVEEVIVTCGNQHGIGLIVQALINKGDYILIETPTYTGAVDIFTNAYAHLLPIKIFEYGFDKEYIEELSIKYKPKLFFLTPNFSNPTGYCLSLEERMQLIELAKKYNFIIVEDDHWSEFSFNEKVRPIGLMKGASKHVIYLRGFSKIIGPDSRIGSLFAPDYIVDMLQRVLTLQSLGVSLLSQQYLYSLIKKGYYKRSKGYILADLRKRLNIVNKFLLPLRQYGLEYDLPEGGLNYWIKLPRSMNSEALLFGTMYENGITFLPGTITNVTIDSNYDSFIRLNFSFLSYNDLKAGLTKFVDLLKHELNNGN